MTVSKVQTRTSKQYTETERNAEVKRLGVDGPVVRTSASGRRARARRTASTGAAPAVRVRLPPPTLPEAALGLLVLLLLLEAHRRRRANGQVTARRDPRVLGADLPVVRAHHLLME